jgi:hypothetical protein
MAFSKTPLHTPLPRVKASKYLHKLQRFQVTRTILKKEGNACIKRALKTLKRSKSKSKIPHLCFWGENVAAKRHFLKKSSKIYRQVDPRPLLSCSNV